MTTPFKPFERFPVLLAQELKLGQGFGKLKTGTQVQACYNPAGHIYLITHAGTAHTNAQIGVDFTLVNANDQARIWTKPQFKQSGGLWKPV